MEDFRYKKKNGNIYYDDCYEDVNGHGTSCISTINRYTKNVEFYPIKILDKIGRSNINILVTAMELLLDVDVDIINISLSSNETILSKELAIIIDKLTEQGKIIVAAASNNRSISIPASMKNVIGVQSFDNNHEGDFLYSATDAIQVKCDGMPIMIPLIGGISQKAFFWRQQ